MYLLVFKSFENNGFVQKTTSKKGSVTLVFLHRIFSKLQNHAKALFNVSVSFIKKGKVLKADKTKSRIEENLPFCILQNMGIRKKWEYLLKLFYLFNQTISKVI